MVYKKYYLLLFTDINLSLKYKFQMKKFKKYSYKTVRLSSRKKISLLLQSRKFGRYIFYKIELSTLYYLKRRFFTKNSIKS